MSDENSVDVRNRIAHGGWFDPHKNRHVEWKHEPYPTWVHIEQADGSMKSFIANNKAEHDALLGKTQEPAKVATVDVANLVTQPEKVAVKRGRPPKAKIAPLPANLE